jgi:Kef-type K+ transport system membrane component KefB
METFLPELAFILFTSMLFSLLFKKLKLPSTVAYLEVGFLLGPFVLNILSQLHLYRIFGNLGISFLLFITGTHLRLRAIFSSHSKIFAIYLLATGILSLALFLGINSLISDWLAALIISVALTFSSTIVSIKLLIENKELETLHGILTFLILIFQDILAGVLIGFIDLSLLNPWILTIVLVTTIFFASKPGQMILERVLLETSKSVELLFLFSLTWMLLFSVLFQLADLGFEIGALVAGILLANTSFSEEIASRLRSLQDFFLLFFFVYMGANFQLNVSLWNLLALLVLAIVLTIAKASTYAASIRLSGYSLNTSIYSGLYLSTTSEFTLVILYLLEDRIPRYFAQELLMLSLISLIISIILIILREQIRNLVLKLISVKPLESLIEPMHSIEDLRASYKYVIFGITKLSREFLFTLNSQIKKDTLVIDLNPEKVLKLRALGFRSIYGDASDPYFLDSLNFKDTKYVVTFIPDIEVNKLLAKYFLSKHFKLKLISIAETKDEEQILKNNGYHVVIPMRKLVARELAKILKLSKAQ